MAPDLFSAMALHSLSRVFPRWSDWSKKAAENSILRTADYPFPQTTPKFLGATVQNYRKRARGDEEAKPTKAFQAWFDRLKKVKEEQLLQSLEKSNMLLDTKVYMSCGADPKDFLLEVASFDSLIAHAQEVKKPVFALNTTADVGSTGIVAEQQNTKIQDVRNQYRGAAVKIIDLMKAV